MVQTEFGAQFLQTGFQGFCILNFGGMFEQNLVCVVNQARVQGFPAVQDQDMLSAMAVSAISRTLVWLARMRSA
jgi:hypothetical protein